jgi:hypothetical protein
LWNFPQRVKDRHLSSAANCQEAFEMKKQTVNSLPLSPVVSAGQFNRQAKGVRRQWLAVAIDFGMQLADAVDTLDSPQERAAAQVFLSNMGNQKMPAFIAACAAGMADPSQGFAMLADDYAAAIKAHGESALWTAEVIRDRANAMRRAINAHAGVSKADKGGDKVHAEWRVDRKGQVLELRKAKGDAHYTWQTPAIAKPDAPAPGKLSAAEVTQAAEAKIAKRLEKETAKQLKQLRAADADKVDALVAERVNATGQEIAALRQQLAHSTGECERLYAIAIALLRSAGTPAKVVKLYEKAQAVAHNKAIKASQQAGEKYIPIKPAQVKLAIAKGETMLASGISAKHG